MDHAFLLTQSHFQHFISSCIPWEPLALLVPCPAVTGIYRYEQNNTHSRLKLSFKWETMTFWKSIFGSSQMSRYLFIVSNVLPRAVSVSGRKGSRWTDWQSWQGSSQVEEVVISDWFGDTNGSVPGFSLEGDYKEETKIIIKGISPFSKPNWLNKS